MGEITNSNEEKIHDVQTYMEKDRDTLINAHPHLQVWTIGAVVLNTHSHCEVHLNVPVHMVKA